MKRVIILTYDYPPNNGGIARLCFEIKKQCKLNGLSVRVVTLASSGTDMENDEDVIRIGTVRVAYIELLEKKYGER